MRYETFVGLRHLQSTRGTVLSVMTVLAIAGVALAVAALTTVTSVMGGFVESFRDRILGVNQHIIVTRFGAGFSEYRLVQDALREVPGVIDASPFILHEMLVTAEGSRSRPGALVKGIDPASLKHRPELLRDGSIDALVFDEENGAPETRTTDLVRIGLGKVLAGRLRVGVGDRVTLISPLRGLEQAGWDVGESIPTFAQFEVGAILDTGFYDYDNRLAVLDYRALQRLVRRGDVVTGVELRVADVLATGAMKGTIEKRLTVGRYRVLDWADINRNLFSMLEFQKLVITLVMTAFVLVASMLILCVLVLRVTEKHREIAILRSMGADARGIVRLFVTEGMLIGAVGTAAGLVLGWLSCLLVGLVRPPLEVEVYRIDRLPVSMHAHEFALAAVGALLLCFVFTLYPAIRASRVLPVEALRYD